MGADERGEQEMVHSDPQFWFPKKLYVFWMNLFGKNSKICVICVKRQGKLFTVRTLNRLKS